MEAAASIWEHDEVERLVDPAVGPVSVEQLPGGWGVFQFFAGVLGALIIKGDSKDGLLDHRERGLIDAGREVVCPGLIPSATVLGRQRGNRGLGGVGPVLLGVVHDPFQLAKKLLHQISGKGE